jgi:hypothetical protein
LDHYSSQAGVALLGTSSSHSVAGRGMFELVSKKDWKGQLQTSLLRKYKGVVEINYAFTQSVKTDQFEATVLLTHSDPLIGSCCISGVPAGTKKASEKSAAESACSMIELNTLKFEPSTHTSDMVAKPQIGVTDYSTGNESAQLLGTALRGLFGDNYTAPILVAPPTPLGSAEVMSPKLMASKINDSMEFLFDPVKDAELSGTGKGLDALKDSDSKITNSDSLRVREEDSKKMPNDIQKDFPKIQDDNGNSLDKMIADPCGDNDDEDLSGFAFLALGIENDPLKGVDPPMIRTDRTHSPKVDTSPISKTEKMRMRGLEELSADSDSFFPKPSSWDRDFGVSIRSPPMTSTPDRDDALLKCPPLDFIPSLNPPLGSSLRNDRGARGFQKDYGNSRKLCQGDNRQKERGPPREFGPRAPERNFGPLGSQRSPQQGLVFNPLSNGSLDMGFHLGMNRNKKKRMNSQASPSTDSGFDGSLHEDLIKMHNDAKNLTHGHNSASFLPPDRVKQNDSDQFSLANSKGEEKGSRGNFSCPASFTGTIDSASKSRMMSIEEELSGNMSEKKAPDWKGELQTFLARNCKDFPFKIEYNSEERVAGGKFVARVTITFDNKEEEHRVVYGIPAVNKKSTERTAAGKLTN